MPPQTTTTCSLQFRKIILEQVKRYPKLQIEDIYKLVYQAAMGNIHLAENTERALEYLKKEFEDIEPDDTLPLIEPISHSGEIVRVNLKPFKAQQRDLEKLGQAMIQSAQSIEPSLTMLLRYWRDVQALAQSGQIPFNEEDLQEFLKKQRKANFPAVHHSEVYRKNYSPAYRVVLRKFWAD